MIGDFITRAKIKVTRWINRPKREDIECLRDHYRKEVLGEEAGAFLESEDFKNLVKVARYADFGVWTALEAAYCLGFKAGKGSR